MSIEDGTRSLGLITIAAPFFLAGVEITENGVRLSAGLVRQALKLPKK